ncbi:TonB-dependent siderophore receptor [Citrobacter koseri]|uniref:TonB-dependent siderophore receptor n=1 Tax=Citrobacter koseri TaxID=545 RepID=UPI00190643F2|nr:TonB-dependent siderophore receptor [Citrobacter koseri]MBJ9122299.1 TonB-dependent siderophore receptor [Citrobacter koseri]MBJ9245713.1 TonB-dependent siderophore receptor [Citrobacter koseri]
MNMTLHARKRPLAMFLASLLSTSAYAAGEESTEKLADGETMIVTAEQELKQQPGVSTISAKDIQKSPPVNDLSDIIRKMPGVNLTGNSASGSRGNNRQIDIRGMGPENTLIMVDGVPVTSRNAVRYSWRGERDTRGDTNWVPAEMVERIEVIRGPAASRYGSGASGGVVNIITKRPTNDWHGSLSLFTSQPEDDKEGATRRANFNLSGPLAGDALTMRMYGNINKTDADAYNINTAENGSYAAGREGVRNKDLNTVLSWKITPLQIVDFSYGYSRQGNIYAGDTQYSNGNISPNGLVESLYGEETNRMYRQSYGVAYNGIWDWGTSKLNFNYEKTNNTRLQEGSTGRVEGMINSDSYETSRLESYRAGGEINFPVQLLVEQTITLGAEWNRDELNDPASMGATDASGVIIDGVSGDPSTRSSKNNSTISSLYFEDNIAATDSTEVIPGIRFDYHDKFGSNWSPSLNISQGLGDYFTLKAGIARAFKAPNLYQSTEGYLLSTRGNGCPVGVSTGSCYLLGNENLDPEISINKEVGIEFHNEGYIAGITWFRNDYKNKIVAGDELVGYASNGYNVLRWENGGKAIVEGLEGNLTIPLVRDTLEWRTNATYMFRSESKKTGNPLSVIPEFTINSQLDWQVTDKLDANINWTQYGRQKPRKYAEIRTESGGAMSNREISPYSIFGLNVNYDITKNLRANAGINNLFDKQIYRENDGASTYNEPGRAYYAGLTMSF